VKEFPDYANGYDSLGDVYLAANDTISAIRAYGESIDKGNNISQAKLKALKKKEIAN
jgi:predicted negative regulator of RcsB-dependent stress response